VGSIPVAAPADYASLFDAERAALLELLGRLAPEDWDRSTPCPGWSVLDLVCHLVGDDFGFLARRRDGHFGTKPPENLAGDDEFARWLDGLQDVWVRASCRISRRIAVDLLAWTGPQVVALFEAEDPGAVEATVSWASSDPVPRWLDQARELSEHWIHRQQILMAVGSPTDTSDAVAVAVLDALRWAYPYRLSSVDRGAGTVAIEVVGDPERRWFVEAGAQGWDFADAAGGEVAAAMRLTADEAWRLLTNNMPAEEQEQLEVSGDPEITRILLATRAIIGVPKVARGSTAG
jgi:uncharacterized protein (TIGR03083 family)